MTIPFRLCPARACPVPAPPGSDRVRGCSGRWRAALRRQVHASLLLRCLGRHR